MYFFDAKLESKAVFKEKIVWTLYLGIMFFLLYGSANNYAHLTAPHASFFMEWEKNIPFIEIFIIPYMSSDILFVLAFLLAHTRLQLRILALRVFSVMAISVCIFVLFPLQFSFEKPQTQNFLFELLKLDLPYNQLPSLHISLAIILWYSMKEVIRNQFIKTALFIWFILIGFSTLLVYQHHFIDLPSAMILALILVYFINEKKAFVKNFTTPRSLKVALFYLAIAAVFLIGSFSYFTYIFLYLFISFFTLSFIYAFAFKNLLIKENGKANLFQWLLFSPYYLASHLSFLYYKKNLPLYSKLNNNIYIGRQASKEEYEELKSLGITKIINLTSELQTFKTDIKELRVPLIDITIQEPKVLNQIAKELEKNTEDKIFIHCKLGMSRTILVIYAYFLNQNKKIDEIKALIKEVRPQYLESKYMDVNIKLYEEFLKNKKD